MNIMGFETTKTSHFLISYNQYLVIKMADAATCEMGVIQAWSRFTLSYNSGIRLEKRGKKQNVLGYIANFHANI